MQNKTKVKYSDEIRTTNKNDGENGESINGCHPEEISLFPTYVGFINDRGLPQSGGMAFCIGPGLRTSSSHMHSPS